jgi:uncharacterized protein YcfJ
MATLNRTARTRTVIAASLLGLATLALPFGGAADDWRRDSNAYYDYAKVTHVQPITRVVQVSTPHEVCWNERVHTVRHGRHRRHRSYTPTVLGGVLGGVVGNQFGRGRGNTAMTVAGALLGASIGRDAAMDRDQYRPATTAYSTERRCEVERVYHEEERVEGYRVTYRFRGRDYVTRTDTDPGNRIRVRVEVDPVPVT